MKCIYKLLFVVLSLFSILTSSSGQCTFRVSDQIVCGQELVQFDVVNPRGLYSWDFDSDGVIDTYGSNVAHQFPPSDNNRTYTISMFRNNNFCSTDTVYVLATPDATIGVVPGSGILDSNVIRVCSGVPTTELSIYNASTTLATNVLYTVNWGDGTVETFDNNTFSSSSVLTHEYNGFGYYNLRITVSGSNTCLGVRNYLFYNGSNPSVGLANPGNTVGLCAPATVVFPITNTGANPAGTEYKIYVSGVEVASYTQSDLPPSFSYTFDETSCGKITSTGNYTNAFDVQIVAINPCGSSQATIEPIEVSEPPELAVNIDEDGDICTDLPITITNDSRMTEVRNGDCFTNLPPSWEILPGADGIDWNLIDGNLFASDFLELEFLLPGEYTIRMTVNSDACGEFILESTITVVESTTASVDLQLTSASSPAIGSCAPMTATFTNNSTGEDIVYNWTVNPPNGWSFGSGTDADDEEPVINFNEGGVYQIILEASNECSDDRWEEYIIISGPPDIDLGPLPSFCESGTLTIDPSMVSFDNNGATITDYSWSFPGATPTSSTDQYPTNIRYDTPGSYTVSVTATNECGSTTETHNLIVYAPGQLSMPSDTGVCLFTSGFQLFAEPSGGTWTGDGVSATGWFTPTEFITGDNVLTYNFAQTGCNLSGTMTVTVWPLPDVEAGPEQSACLEDTPFVISGGTPTGGTWTSDRDGVIDAGTIFDPAASGTGVYTLTYTYTDANGCTGSDTKVLVVNDPPTVEAGPDWTICDNPTDIPLDGFYPANGSWSGPGVTSGGIFNANRVGPGSYTLYYTFNDPGTFCTAIDSMVITVSPNESAYAGPDTTICINSGFVELNQATPAGGAWSGPGVISAAQLFDPSAAGVGTHTITYTAGTGICQTSDELVIFVNDLPRITLPPTASLCGNDDPLLLAATPAGGSWNGPGIIGNYFNPDSLDAGDYFLEYTYTDPATGCTNKDQMRVELLPVPNVQSHDTLYCNQAVVVDLPIATPIGGTWSGPGVVNNKFDPADVGPGTYQINYRYTAFYGCSDEIDINVEVVEAEQAEAGPDDTLCVDQGIIQLYGFSPLNGRWTGNGIVDEINGQFDPAEAGAGRHVLTYSFGKGSCMVRDKKVIWVVDLEDVDAGPDLDICVISTPILLEGQTPVGGVWTGIGIIDPIRGIFDPNEAQPGTYILTYTFEDPFSLCFKNDTRVVEVFPMERPDFEAPERVCRNQPVTFTNLSPTNMMANWRFGDGGTSTDFQPTYSFDAVGSYTITLTMENNYGCIDSIKQDIEVVDVPLANFELDASDACSGITLGLENLSSGFDISYEWDLGNGETSTDSIPDLTYFVPGLEDTTYIITLKVTNECGTSFHQDVVTVQPVPTAGVGLSPDSDCSPVTVSFANGTIGNATGYYWDFGNGNTSEEAIPDPEVYTADGVEQTYIIQLIAYNICSSDTATQTVVVTPPDAESIFSATPKIGCSPLAVEFTNNSDPRAKIDWDFGDGNTSSEKEPSHVFMEPGNYQVIQYASNTCGYDTSTTNITVLPAPEVTFTNDAIACLGQIVTFTNTSQGLSGTFWDFGDGDTSSFNNPVHAYQEPGTYTVTLRGISQFNQCEAIATGTVRILELPVAAFEPAENNGCAPFTVTFINNSIGDNFYKWEFGDGNFKVGEEVAHTFEEVGSFDVKLIATDENGCYKDTSVFNILVHPSPDAGFEIVEEQLCRLPANILFENTSTQSDAFEWNFGDGTTSTRTNPLKVFESEGEYDITLYALNQYGCKDTVRESIQVYQQPIADFYVSEADGCEPVQVVFENTSKQVNHFFWDLGDGTISEERNPIHLYEDAGTYDVKLIASIDSVCFDTIEKRSLVYVQGKPTANFDMEEVIEDNIRSGTFQFLNLSEGGSTYFWDFGDGSVSDQFEPVHRFGNNGLRQVYLEVTSEYGCVADTMINVDLPCIKGLFVPNGFSPEQGIGDVRLFKPKGIGLKEYHIQVFSPYGQLIWESTEIENGQPAEAWDGTMNGELLQQDVYVWKASAIFCDGTSWKGMKTEGGTTKNMGSVILLR